MVKRKKACTNMRRKNSAKRKRFTEAPHDYQVANNYPLLLNTGLDFLPDIVVLHIFSYLSAIELLTVQKVCQRWNELAKIEGLWWNVEVQFDRTVLDKKDKKFNYLAEFDDPWRGDWFDKPDCNYDLPLRCLTRAPVLGTLKICQIIYANLIADAILDYTDPKRIRRLSFTKTDIGHDEFFDLLSLFGDELEELQVLCYASGVFSIPDTTTPFVPVPILPALKKLETWNDPRSLRYFDVADGVNEGPSIPFPNCQELKLHLAESSLTPNRTLLRLVGTALRKIVLYSLQDLVIPDWLPIRKLGLFPNLEEITFSCIDNLKLKWSWGISDNWELHIGRDITFLHYPILSMFGSLGESIAKLTVYFAPTSFELVARLLKTATPGLKKLTLNQLCLGYENDCQSVVNDIVNYPQWLTEIIEHNPIRDLDSFTLKGCKRFIDNIHELFVEHTSFHFELQKCYTKTS